jgi:hypothetical protein
MHQSDTTEMPDLAGFEDFYGMKVSAIGDDGDLIILGHHNPTYALAAFTAYSVNVLGLSDIYDGHCADPGPTAAAAICHKRASLLTECDEARESDHDLEDCSLCAEIADHLWYLEIGEQEQPNTFPVTYFTA